MIVFVFATEGKPASNRYGGFAAKLQQVGALPGQDIVTVALENLAYCIHESGEAEVTDTVSGVNLADADYVYLKSWESMPEEAAALAIYLEAKSVPFADELPAGMGFSKLAAGFRLWAAGVPMPETVYIRRTDRLLEYLEAGRAPDLGETFVAKDVFGEKGRDNHLTTRHGLERIIAAKPSLHYICQRFIPNDGDYRLGVYFGRTRFAIKRVGSGGSHLNNTSAGAKAEYIPVTNIESEIAELAEQAAEAARLQVGGVDIIIDNESQIAYVLEVNQGSQIVSGAYSAENKVAFSQGINEAVAGIVRKPVGPAQVIGRKTCVAIPALGIVEGLAKMDTGAYTSTIHAENIRIESDGDGEVLVFDIVPGRKIKLENGETMTKRVSEFFHRKIRSSNGLEEIRYGFDTDIIINGQRCRTTVTLSDRSSMFNPILIGRQTMKGRFIVDVSISETGIRLQKDTDADN